jgi:hypothetical protein
VLPFTVTPRASRYLASSSSPETTAVIPVWHLACHQLNQEMKELNYSTQDMPKVKPKG